MVADSHLMAPVFAKKYAELEASESFARDVGPRAEGRERPGLNLTLMELAPSITSLALVSVSPLIWNSPMFNRGQDVKNRAHPQRYRR